MRQDFLEINLLLLCAGDFNESFQADLALF